MKQRRDEIDEFARSWGEPACAHLRSAMRCQDKWDLDAAARIAADQVQKRPALRWPALLLALEAVEIRFGGSVSIATPARGDVGGLLELVLYPDKIAIIAELEDQGDNLYTLRSPSAVRASTYEPLALEAMRALAAALAAHLHCVIELDV